MSHTPEPWHLPKGSTCMESNSGEVPRSEANARRIVAAVNACAGIETYALELMTGELSLLNQVTHKLRERPTKKAVQYRKQRDELLAALELIIERFGHCQNDYAFSKRIALDKARTAIAAVKGTET